MVRSGHVSFIRKDDEVETKKAYCRVCEERGLLNKLVPRILDNGVKDDHHKICSFCAEVYPIYEIKIEPMFEPKGTIASDPYSTMQVKVIRDRRKIKTKRIEGIEEIDVPDFGNKPDKELESMLTKDSRPAVLNFIDDQVVDDYE